MIKDIFIAVGNWDEQPNQFFVVTIFDDNLLAKSQMFTSIYEAYYLLCKIVEENK